MFLTKKTCFNLYLDYLIYLLLLLYVIIDCLTGFAKDYNVPSPAVPYKFLLMVLMTLSIALKSQVSIESQLYISSIIYFYLMTLVCLLYYLFKYDTSFSDSLSMIMRIIFAPIIYIHIKETYYNISTTDSYYYIEKLVKINLVVFCINQMFGLIGFGKNTYTVDAPGIKGFLFDGNAAAVMIFCIYVYYFITSKYKRMVSFFFVFLGILLGTKVSILSIVLYMILSKIILLKRLKKLIYLFFMPLLIFILFYIGYINHIFDYHLERISRLYSMFGKNMVAALLSGRNIDLANRFKYYKENISIRQIFFGYGYLSNMKIIEIDLFDTLFSYGLLIFLPILYFYGYTAYINRKNKKILLFNILYFVISITSGHVWFNTSSALFYGIINTQLARKNK